VGELDLVLDPRDAPARPPAGPRLRSSSGVPPPDLRGRSAGTARDLDAVPRHRSVPGGAGRPDVPPAVLVGDDRGRAGLRSRPIPRGSTRAGGRTPRAPGGHRRSDPECRPGGSRSFPHGEWILYAGAAGASVAMYTEHPPWRMRETSIGSIRQSVSEHLGLPEPGRPPVVHFSDGVDARLSRPFPMATPPQGRVRCPKTVETVRPAGRGVHRPSVLMLRGGPVSPRVPRVSPQGTS
jgi:Uncharacterized conserved protein (COG2071)